MPVITLFVVFQSLCLYRDYGNPAINTLVGYQPILFIFTCPSLLLVFFFLEGQLFSRLLHTGYVSTVLNRRRWLPHIKSYDFTQRSQAERQAVNFIVQGLCIYDFKSLQTVCHYSVGATSVQ